MSKTAELIIDGKSYVLPLVVGSENEVAIDISELMEKTGAITLDLGYKNTGATKSAITYLDGDNGILRYRGYGIEELAQRSNFMEVSYLLIFGELPNQQQYNKFTHDRSEERRVGKECRSRWSQYHEKKRKSSKAPSRRRPRAAAAACRHRRVGGRASLPVDRSARSCCRSGREL